MEDFPKISLNEIKKKLKRKKSIIDFFMEFSNYNLIFLIVRYYYFSKRKFFAKNHIIEQFTGDSNLHKNLLDIVKPCNYFQDHFYCHCLLMSKKKYKYLYDIQTTKSESIIL